MELEKTSPIAITDEQRQRAALRQATLTPLNPFMKPDSAPDPVVVMETHANVSLDSEDTDRENGALLRPSQGTQIATPATQQAGTKKHHGRVFILLVASLIVGALGGAAYFVFVG